jgi:RimJ/RimL family protein N-acetyltransferase
VLVWSWADSTNDGEFSDFVCCEGPDAEPWVQQAELYVRAWVLREALPLVLTHRNEDGELVGVSAFERTVVGLPPATPEDPVDHAGWHLLVVAVALDHRGSGLSQEVFAGTFEAMRQRDPDRYLVTANVHHQHHVSLRACANAGLTLWRPLDRDYWTLAGTLPA